MFVFLVLDLYNNYRSKMENNFLKKNPSVRLGKGGVEQ